MQHAFDLELNSDPANDNSKIIYIWFTIIPFILVVIDGLFASSLQGDTGFIKACWTKGEKAVDLILANYQRLKIDLKIKDNHGRKNRHGLLARKV